MKYSSSNYEDFEMSDEFRAAWSKKEALGYQYGRDALEGVRFGFEIAEEEFQAALAQLRAQLAAQTAIVEAAKAWARKMRDAQPAKAESFALMNTIDAAEGAKVRAHPESWLDCPDCRARSKSGAEQPRCNEFYLQAPPARRGE